jgi:hypothetical protein
VFYPDSLIAFVAGLPASSKLLLRSGNKSEPGLFEQMIAKLAITLWLDVEWFRPDPAGGRGATFERDLELVRSSDLVLAYFSTTTIIGGTAHVVEKAIDQDVPVYAYGFTGDGYIRVGEHDPDDRWGKSVPP